MFLLPLPPSLLTTPPLNPSFRGLHGLPSSNPPCLSTFHTCCLVVDCCVYCCFLFSSHLPFSLHPLAQLAHFLICPTLQPLTQHLCCCRLLCVFLSFSPPPCLAASTLFNLSCHNCRIHPCPPSNMKCHLINYLVFMKSMGSPHGHYQLQPSLPLLPYCCLPQFLPPLMNTNA
jgi:hypothetical protein